MARFKLRPVPREDEYVDALEMTMAISVTMPDGEVMSAEVGDYIVTRADGTQYVAKRTDFLDAYDLVKIGRRGRPAGSKNRVDDDGDDDDGPDEEEPSLPFRGNGRKVSHPLK